MTQDANGPEREQIHIKVHPTQKEKWKQEVEANQEYKSLTHLIQLSVSKEIADSANNNSNHRASKDIAELKDIVASLSEDMGMVQSALSDLQRTVKSKPSDKHLRGEIFAALPTRDSMKGPVSASELAEELGPVDESVVAQVLQDMADDIGVVQEVIATDGTEQYQKKQ